MEECIPSIVRSKRPQISNEEENIVNHSEEYDDTEEPGSDFEPSPLKKRERGARATQQIRKRSKRAMHNDDEDEDDDDDDYDGLGRRRNGGLNDYDDNDEYDSEPENEGDCEIGQVVKIEVENFMNLRKFSMQFGHHMNFITGRNGSGKSAIATALMLCLGSKAQKTGRASNMSEMIREGSPGPAIVKVYLRNDGDLAYRPGDFGNRIMIERTITRTASGGSGGGFKLYGNPQGDNGRYVVVSSNKKELGIILDRFSIFVENPCCVLTQEASKKFIQGKEDAKYEFFLKATGLEKMLETNKDVRARLDETKAKVDGFQESVESKNLHRKKLKAELADLMSFSEHEQKIATIACKHYWITVGEEKEVLERFQDNLRVLTEEHEKLKVEQANASNAAREDGDPEMLKNEIAEFNEAISKVAAALASKHIEVKKMQQRITNHENAMRDVLGECRDRKQRVKAVEDEIRALKQKAQGGNEGDQQALENQIESINQQLQDFQDAEARAREEIQVAKDRKRELQDSRTDGDNKTKSLVGQINKLKSDIASISGTSGKLHMFGSNVPAILRKAEEQGIPIKGPVGSLIRIKEGFQQYEGAIERCLGPLLMSFVVSNEAERVATGGILVSFDSKQHTIITQAAVPRYNVMALTGLPDGVKAILEMIVIDDDQIFNAVIDQCKPEGVAAVLGPEDEITRRVIVGDGFSVQGLKTCMTADGMYAVSFSRSRNKSSVPRAGGIRRLLVSDVNEAIASKRNELQRLESDLASAKSQLPNYKDDETEIHNQFEKAAATIKKCSEGMRKVKRTKAELESQLREIHESRSIDTSFLDGEKADLVDAIAQDQQVADEMRKQLEGLQTSQSSLKREKDELENVQAQHQEKIDSISKKVSNILSQLEHHKKLVARAAMAVESKEKQCRDVEVLIENQQNKYNTVIQEATANTSARVESWDGQPLVIGKKETKKLLEQQVRQMTDILERSKYSVHTYMYFCLMHNTRS